MRCRKHPSPRRGSLIIEAVISVALLATAMFALATLAQSSSSLQQQSDQRLAATLAAQNVIARLQGIPIDSLDQQAKQAAETVQVSSGCTLKASTSTFTAAGRQGIHLQVDASPTDGVTVTLHDWFLDSPTTADPSTGDEEKQPSENPNQENGGDDDS